MTCKQIHQKLSLASVQMHGGQTVEEQERILAQSESHHRTLELQIGQDMSFGHVPKPGAIITLGRNLVISAANKAQIGVSPISNLCDLYDPYEVLEHSHLWNGLAQHLKYALSFFTQLVVDNTTGLEQRYFGYTVALSVGNPDNVDLISCKNEVLRGFEVMQCPIWCISYLMMSEIMGL